MNRSLPLMLGCLALFSTSTLANRSNVDVVVPVSPEIWGSARNSTPPPCNRCCIYQNQNYSEGALLKVEGELLQCARDPNVTGTSPLIWIRLKQ
ncbi:uncharacterized protein DUF1496 [Serratia fonticola]|jgi:hypothetical protein|uniref:Uncharacterized protein DUF1496 n=1 Tax=Serratia fonticola TaxID=47917 RepID=A0A542BQ83_SERFO|nr:DUF1496 domain-containing protein [Serratia fonticola]TQI80742.1 uncharacterized protein DUF1496 [Serratia fonticola]TQI97233.1 uncharacterized protein DUF1496 [Serratia fonticola]TVZ71729.1 uncharacterized protein DUF1496 [Serratia fonticola]